MPQGGFSAGEMLKHVQGVDAARREKLIRVLDIEPDWHMNKVSDGQRRRVQIAMGLLRPFKVCWRWPSLQIQRACTLRRPCACQT